MTEPTLTEDQKSAIWDVLMGACGASERWRRDFLHHFPQCTEYRFQGNLGFGGKVYADWRRVYVNCYSEDATPERLATIERANTLLAALVNPIKQG